MDREKGFCFFCKSTWHETFDCPALLEKEPRKIFKSILNLTFSEISQLIWQGIKENFSADKLKIFYVRQFYLLPEFLRIVFFRSKDITTWPQFDINVESPIRGGNLGLGLEALMTKDLETAKREFLEVEDELTSSMGLAFVELLNKNFKEVFSFIDKALSLANTPFLRSYLLFLKGYLYEYTKSKEIAKEFYRDAYQTDSTCFPAIYYLNLSKYQEVGSLSQIFPYFNHIYFYYWAFLEPILIKDQEELESWLYKILGEKREEASQRLKEAEDKYHKIKEFLSQKERERYEEELENLRKKYTKKD